MTAPTIIRRSCAPKIDRINARVYSDVNIGVYRAGFATAQSAYEEGCRAVFAALDWIEEFCPASAISPVHA